MKRILFILITLCICTNIYTDTRADLTHLGHDPSQKKESKREKIVKGALLLAFAALGVGVSVKMYRSLSKIYTDDVPKKKPLDEKDKEHDSTRKYTDDALRPPILRWYSTSTTLTLKDSETSTKEKRVTLPFVIFSHPNTTGEGKGKYLACGVEHTLYTYAQAEKRYLFETLQKATQELADKNGCPCKRIIMGVVKQDQSTYQIGGKLLHLELHTPEKAIALFEEARKNGEAVALYIFDELKKH